MLSKNKITVERDVRIVGGGLAGLFLGILLRKQGVTVSIDEAGSYPRHRVCGEFLCGRGMQLLREAGLDTLFPDALENRTVAWYRGEACVFSHELPEPAYGISRNAMDLRLAHGFADAGGVLRQNSRVSAPDTGVEGVVSCAGRRLSKDSGEAWLGLKIHLLDFPLQNDLEMHLGDGAYVGLSRIEEGRVNVCGLFRLREKVGGKREARLWNYLHGVGLGGLARRLSSSAVDRASFVGVAGISFRAQPTGAAGGSPVLGDAMAAIPPFTGNGMSIALECASIAAPVLTDYCRGELDWVECCAVLKRGLTKRFGRRFSAARWLHPLLLSEYTQRVLAFSARKGLLPVSHLFKWTH